MYCYNKHPQILVPSHKVELSLVPSPMQKFWSGDSQGGFPPSGDSGPQFDFFYGLKEHLVSRLEEESMVLAPFVLKCDMIPTDVSWARTSHMVAFTCTEQCGSWLGGISQDNSTSWKKALICVGQQPSRSQEGWEWWEMRLEWRLALPATFWRCEFIF